MNQHNFHKIFIWALAFLMAACSQEMIELREPTPPTVEPGPDPDPGTADFTKFISIGNSLTAGFMNGALYDEGQNSNFAVIMAAQFESVGGGAFNQPDINSTNGFFTMGPEGPLGRLILRGNPPSPQPIGPGDLPSPFTGDKAALNNFGVPGITLGTALIPETGGNPDHPAFNPLYSRFASNPGQSTVVSDAATAMANGGTFFSFWLGNNDVLGYAVGGASNPAILTSTNDFQQRFGLALGAFLQAAPASKGVVFNIPDVTTIPYFTLVPWNPIPLDQSTADALTNQLAGGYNQFLAAMVANNVITQEEAERRNLRFEAREDNPILIQDETLTDLSNFMIGPAAALRPYAQARQTTNQDRITLPTSSILGTPVADDPSAIWGVTVPLRDENVLIPSEIAEIASSVASFNEIIQGAVNQNSDRLVLVNINQVFTEFAMGGAFFDGVLIQSTFVPPFGAFSLDGVHPNPRGHAFVARKAIEAINAKFSATIPLPNIGDYPGTELPQ